MILRKIFQLFKIHFLNNLNLKRFYILPVCFFHFISADSNYWICAYLLMFQNLVSMFRNSKFLKTIHTVFWNKIYSWTFLQEFSYFSFRVSNLNKLKKDVNMVPEIVFQWKDFTFSIRIKIKAAAVWMLFIMQLYK